MKLLEIKTEKNKAKEQTSKDKQNGSTVRSFSLVARAGSFVFFSLHFSHIFCPFMLAHLDHSLQPLVAFFIYPLVSYLSLFPLSLPLSHSLFKLAVRYIITVLVLFIFFLFVYFSL